MSPQEFSTQIKQKYPQYKNVDDIELANKMVEKYPQYASKVNFEQAKPEVKQNGLKSGAIGVAKGVGNIALGIGTLGRSIQKGVSKVTGIDITGGESVFDKDSGKRAKAEAALEPKNKGEAVASFVTEVGATFAPSAAVYKATKGIGMAMKILGRGGGGAVTGTIQGGGDIDKDTAIGAAAETILPGVASGVTKYGGNVLKSLAGLVSGKGGDVIEQVLKNPDAALKGAKEPSTAVLRDMASSIRNGVKQIRQKAGAEFEAMTKDYTEPLDKKAFNSMTDEFFGNVKEEMLTKPKGLDELKVVISSWKDHSPQGLNKLASKVSKFYSGSDKSKDIDGIISGLNRTIRDWVGKQVPEILEANAKYADKMDLLENMEVIFKTKGAFTGRKEIAKTAEALGRLFNANKDIAREGVEEVEKELGIQILGKEAGRQLVDGVSRSQSAIGDATTGVAKSFISPKVILQIAARTGQTSNAITKRLDTLSPAARATTIEFLTDLLGDEESLPEESKKVQ